MFEQKHIGPSTQASVGDDNADREDGDTGAGLGNDEGNTVPGIQVLALKTILIIIMEVAQKLTPTPTLGYRYWHRVR